MLDVNNPLTACFEDWREIKSIILQIGKIQIKAGFELSSIFFTLLIYHSFVYQNEIDWTINNIGQYRTLDNK